MWKTRLRQSPLRANFPRRHLNTVAAAVDSSRYSHPPPPPTRLRPWLLVGLGNPGEKYRSTRHNVGFQMIDAFARSVDISTGAVHFKALFGQGGGHGGHKGLKSVIHHFRGNKEFGRLRIGIGRPPGQMDPKAFVLQNFNATACDQIEAALQEGIGILKALIAKGLTECARSANIEQKYNYSRHQTMSI